MNTFTVYKLDDHGREVWQYPATVLERSEHCVRLEAFFNRQDMDLGFTTFKQGDRFIEYFYSDRWYNLFVVYDRDDGRLKGWYANICRPAQIEDTAVRCEDLALDLWVDPHGNTQLLDEAEFAALDLSPAERAKCRTALLHLLNTTGQERLPR